MKRLLLATGNSKIDNAVKIRLSKEIDYEIIGSVDLKRDLINKVKEEKPDLVIVSKILGGKDYSILETLLTIRTESPNTRIIYLAGHLDTSNKEKVNELATLVMSGVYDIIHERDVSLDLIKELINHPREREQVLYLIKHIKTNVVYEEELVEVEEVEEVEDVEEEGYKNVFLVSSIKPGTGKSFVSTNLATCIAKYGKRKENGEKPKVAIIEADLQNLSVGTVLKIDDDKEYNLKTVMDKIATIIDKNGDLIDDRLQIMTVNNFIENSFQQYSFAKNLYALVGSRVKMEEINDVKPLYYVYLIEKVLEDFDVVIVDTNSSLAHTTTLPLLKMCNTAYYVIDLDFNNISNNIRYKETLEDIEVSDKIKYVLNKDITEENRELTNRILVEPLEFNADSIKELGFDLVARIPELPIEVFLNRLFAGQPVILDNKDYTLKVRHEISKIANEIWPIENIDLIEKDYEKYKEKFFASKTKKGGLFFRK